MDEGPQYITQEELEAEIPGLKESGIRVLDVGFCRTREEVIQLVTALMHAHEVDYEAIRRTRELRRKIAQSPNMQKDMEMLEKSRQNCMKGNKKNNTPLS